MAKAVLALKASHRHVLDRLCLHSQHEAPGLRAYILSSGALMQVGQTITTSFQVPRLSDKEVRILAEIGLDEIATATSFVEYVCMRLGISRSGAWYCLKKLKKQGVVEFTEKGEEYRPLRMTEKGLGAFRAQSRVRNDGNGGHLPTLGVGTVF